MKLFYQIAGIEARSPFPRRDSPNSKIFWEKCVPSLKSSSNTNLYDNTNDNNQMEKRKKILFANE